MSTLEINYFDNIDNSDESNEFHHFVQNNLFLKNSESYPFKNNESFNFGLLSISNSNSNESKVIKNSENIINIIENAQTKEISNNINQLNEKPINTNQGNDEVVVEVNNNNNNNEVKFQSNKKGRPKKGKENQGNKKHTRDSNDNARKKIINSCKSSIYNLISKYIPTQLDIKLHIPTIEKQMGYSQESINKFFNKKIYNIFCDTIPKKLKDEIKNNREQYQHNTYAINMLLENE